MSSRLAPRSAQRKAEDALLAELREIYRDADNLTAGWSCPASTDCCRFAVTGLEPYVTSIELLELRRGIARRGGMLSAAMRAEPREEYGSAQQERTCPMLNKQGRCSVYESRPLGCRTFFCERAVGHGKLSRTEVHALVRRIQALAARHEPGGDQGKKLMRAI